LALSGGGHRAALFAVGALICLVDLAENSAVSSIASVSGGSLTNGVLAAASEDYNAMSATDVRAAFGNLIRRCAHTGTVQGSAPARAVMLGWLVSFLLGVVGFCWGIVGWPGGWYVGLPMIVVFAALFVWLYESISWIAQRVFDRMFFAGRLLREIDTRVTHVFCATELQAKLHTYFSGRFVYN
jgi:hypothetical protein